MKNHKRFWSKVDRSAGVDACWPWRGHIGSSGHGVARMDGVSVNAHRKAWALTFGIPDGLHVLHRCDNPPCCNPAHLFLGTNENNSHDAAAKGRLRPPHGTKLNIYAVRVIRWAFATGLSRSRIAAAYSTTPSNVFNITERLTWRWVQ